MKNIYKKIHNFSKSSGIKIHHLETLFVAVVLSIVALISGKGKVEWIGVLGVVLTFEYQVLSTYLTEHGEARKNKQSEKDKKNFIYSEIRLLYFLKEFIWVVYFIFLGAYSAIIGAIIFVLYAFWRKGYRKYIPLSDEEII